jgi:hypothetical protein
LEEIQVNAEIGEFFARLEREGRLEEFLEQGMHNKGGKERMAQVKLQENMNACSAMMQENSVHLGPAPTYLFLAFLWNARPGDIYTYSTGFHFYTKSAECLQELEILSVKQTLEDISIDNFKSRETQIYDISDTGKRKLFRLARDLRTENCFIRCTDYETIKKELDKAMSQVNLSETKKFYVDKEFFVGQKTPTGIRWFDKDNHELEENIVVRFYAWAKTSPVELSISFSDKDMDSLDEYDYDYCKTLEDLQNALTDSIYYIDKRINLFLKEHPTVTFSATGLLEKANRYEKIRFDFALKNGLLYLTKTKHGQTEQVSFDAFLPFFEVKFDTSQWPLYEVELSEFPEEVEGGTCT